MGFLDRAKKLAEQAKDLAQQAMGEGTGSTAGPDRSPPPAPTDPRWGTPYVPGMLGRPGWREKGLADPAAVLPIAERDRAGVPRSTRSQILEEPYGMGRRWASGTTSAALYYQLYPEHRSWVPPGGKVPFAEVAGASAATLDDGRSLVFLSRDDRSVVLELSGLDESARVALARAVAAQLAPA